MSAVVDFPVKPEARPYLDAFAERGGEPQWLRELRRRHLKRFAELGFPSRKSESWRYLDLQPLQRQPLPPGEAGSLSAVPLDLGFDLAWVRVIMLDGNCQSIVRRSPLPEGVWIASMRRAIVERPDLVQAVITSNEASENPFNSLNAALFADGVVIDIAPETALDQPIEIIHFSSPGGSKHTRSIVNLAEGARAGIVETFAGEGRYWRNDVLALRLAAGAVLNRVALVEEAGEALHTAAMDVGLAAAARLTSFALLLGGGTLRQEVVVRSEGEGAHCGLYGGFVASRRQQANIVTTVDHLAERGETREIFKGVAAGRAHGAFQGRITVRPGAQKVDAHMLSRNLLLGAHAAIDTKPELEIFADDVKCSHGAAVGDLDETALFYLLARGIPREQARHMLIEAFMREAVEIVEPGALREHLLARLGQRLAMLEE
ncbi:MAG: Fe-S cluster assembly protein SufD [Stellaceae bacterium]